MTAGSASLFVERVRDLAARPPITCRRADTVAEIARVMSRARVGSVVVVDDAARPVGIVTDRDLRGRVVAEGRDPLLTCADEVMSSPLVTITPSAFAFDALLTMTKLGIHHLVVMDGDALRGVVSTNDLLVHDTTHPVHLAEEVTRAASVAALAALATRITALVRRLVDTGATAHDVGQLVAELNDRLVSRVLTLVETQQAETEAGPPPMPYCWLALGSEARREQTLHTDQDNGLVYEDPPPESASAVAVYFQGFTRTVVEALVAIGFPVCPGDIMASNPRWCQPKATWLGYFQRWMEQPEPKPVLEAQIHFDLRPIAGATALGDDLRALIVREAPRHRLFLGLIARDIVNRRVPLTVFGNVAVERRGPRRGTVDVKAGATMALSGAARIAALELGLPETNTIERLRSASARGLYTEAETREITDAFQHVTRIRLVHQLAQLARAEPPDNCVRVDRLSRADALLFRDALSTVKRVQAGLRERFKTDLMG